MKKKLSKIILLSIGILSLSTIGIVSSVLVSTTETEAVITGYDVRIAVVRPDWWETTSAIQYLRVAPTAGDLDNNTNVTNYSIESYTADTYYKVGGGFIEYNTNGVVFYDIPYASLVGKYVDLVRMNPSGGRWNKTGSEQFNDGMLHKIWRIWGDGNGVHRPDGTLAESRNVSNDVVNSLLYGYLTCSENTYNGFKAFGSLNNHFNLSGRTYSDTDTVLDFAYNEGNYDFNAGRGTGVTVKIADKVAKMKSMYDASQAQILVNPKNENSLYQNIFVVATVILSLTAIGSLYIIKRKKQLN